MKSSFLFYFITQHLKQIIHEFIYLTYLNMYGFYIYLRCKCNGTPLQYSCLENPMEGGAWQAAVHGVARSRTRLSNFTFTFHFHALEKEWQATPVFLPGESWGGRAWWAAVCGVTQSWTRLSIFTFTFHFHALEKEMANHSSVLAWRIPGTEELGGLPSVGSHRVGHD